MIGLGVGLSLTVVIAIEILRTLYNHMNIVGYMWDKPIALVPFFLVVIGSTLLLPRKEKRERAQQ
jgi:hypothetical protein